MNDNDKELMNRYIYDVTKRVPEMQRKEIAMELEELITDMVEAKNISVEEALVELGKPSLMARKYKNQEGYLIGPDYYDLYLLVLKIALVSVGVTNFLTDLFCFITKDTKTMGDIITSFTRIFTDCGATLCGIFVTVTIVFAIVERAKQPGSRSDTEKFNPQKLAHVPKDKARISRLSSIVDLVVVLVFGTFLLVTPKQFGILTLNDTGLVDCVPFFNMDKWNAIWPLLAIMLSVEFIDGIIRLVNGCYCKTVLISTAIKNTIVTVAAVVLFSSVEVWNPHFSIDVQRTFGKKFISDFDLLANQNSDNLSRVILAVLLILIAINMISTIYKTIAFRTTDKD